MPADKRTAAAHATAKAVQRYQAAKTPAAKAKAAQVVAKNVDRLRTATPTEQGGKS
jgi:hypothetical protein